MTDRISSLMVVLDHNIRDDDVRAIVNAVGLLRGVLDVIPNVAQVLEQDIGARRERTRIEEIIWNALQKGMP